MLHTKCNCAICQRNALFNVHIEMIKAAGLESSHKFLQSLYSELCCIELDNDVNKAIIDGSWPTADKVIEMAREKRSDTELQGTKNE